MDIMAALLTSMRRRRLVFLQLNPLVEQALSTMRDELVTASLDLLPADLSDPALLLIDPFDTLLGDSDPTQSLGRARVAVNQLLDAGHSICLVSRVPRMGFPRCPGSSLLDDAYVFHADSTLGREMSAWNAELDASALRACLVQLGPDVLACLDYLFFDLQIAQAASTSLISPLELEAIRGAGLVRIDASGQALEAALPHSRLLPSLSDSISDHLGVQPDFPAVASALVEIERRIRRSLQAKAVEQFGEKWRGAVLGADLKEKVEDRATQELSRTATVKGLRSPFEWMTMGELVDTTRNASWTERLGRGDRYWQRFASEVMPVRNRLSHMRFLRQQDRARVEHWRAALERALG